MSYNYQPPSRSSRKKVLKQFGTHICYGEGIKTEPKYVENMKKVLKTRYKMNPASDIIIVDEKSGGRSTLGLVEYAEQDVKTRIKDGQKIDHVWIFYDKDSFKKDQLEAIENIKADYDEGKSKAQRLRAVLYRTWEQDNLGYEVFDDYYNYRMEKLITLLKNKLD